jgi:hypothetical protein
MNEILFEILSVVGVIGLSGLVVFLFVFEPRLGT